MNASENDSPYLRFEKHSLSGIYFGKATIHPTTSIRDIISKYNDCSCAWTRRNWRSNWFRIDFLLLFASRQKVDKDFATKKVKEQSSSREIRRTFSSLILIIYLNIINHAKRII